MTINFLESVCGTLMDMGLVHSRREFCEQWLGRQEGYIRTLRFYCYQPSVYVLAVLANRLDHYARHFSKSDVVVQGRLETLGADCWRDIEQRSRLAWMRAEASRSRERRQGDDVETQYKESVNG